MTFFEESEFWVALAFVVFVVLVYRPMRRTIVGALDARAERIKAEIEEAVRLREEAQALLAGYQRKQRQTEDDVKEIVAHARDEAERLRQQAAKDLEAALKRRERQAMDRIAQAEAQALKEVRGLAVDVAIDATRRILSDKVDKKKKAELIDEAISELPKRLQ